MVASDQPLKTQGLSRQVMKVAEEALCISTKQPCTSLQRQGMQQLGKLLKQGTQVNQIME